MFIPPKRLNFCGYLTCSIYIESLKANIHIYKKTCNTCNNSLFASIWIASFRMIFSRSIYLLEDYIISFFLISLKLCLSEQLNQLGFQWKRSGIIWVQSGRVWWELSSSAGINVLVVCQDFSEMCTSLSQNPIAAPTQKGRWWKSISESTRKLGRLAHFQKTFFILLKEVTCWYLTVSSNEQGGM